jgi:hypothetical protein
MTTATATSHAPATPVQRILNVVRLHFANPWTTIVLPWIILGIIFFANLAIWAIIMRAAGPQGSADAAEGFQWSGASMYIFVYMMVVAIQAISITFPFALGYGVTRRDYYLGSALTFVILSAMYAVGLTILAVIEEATNGWGLGGRMFTAAYFGNEAWPLHLFIIFVAFLFFFFVGAAIASVWVRWKANGVVIFFAALGALLIGAVALLTFTENWGIVGSFFANAGFLGSYAWSLVPTAIAAVVGFFILRRATPRAA